jgi:DNA repair protein RadA/Sms
MSREKTVYTCTECGGTSAKWLGKCPQCNAWNTLVESVAEGSGAASKNRLSTPSYSGYAGLAQADELFMGNSVRGLVRVRLDGETGP